MGHFFMRMRLAALTRFLLAGLLLVSGGCAWLRPAPTPILPPDELYSQGEQELERRWWAIVLSGLSAGLSMGLSLIVQGEFHALISDEAVVLGRQRLFTRTR